MCVRLRNYIHYAEEGDWPYEHGELLIVLMTCPDKQTQNKLNRQIYRVVEEGDMRGEIIFATTTQEELKAATTTSKPWYKINEDTEHRRIGL